MAQRAKEWPLLPVSEVMTAPNWQDGHVLWRADDPKFERISVLDLCDEYFFHGSPDGPVCHRVAALARDPDDESRLTCAAVISMSDVVRSVLRENIGARAAAAETADAADELATLSENVTVADLGLVTAPPFTVDADRPALRAFEDMVAAGFTCAAVVCASTGNVVGNLSASDVRAVLPDRFGLLAASTREFLVAARAASFPAPRYPRRGDTTPPPLFCHRSTTFADAVRLMTDGGLHHAFVADDCAGDAAVADAAMAGRAAGCISAHDLVGVVTLTDVLRRVCFEDAYDARGTESDGT
jgi:CBS domain-containing protein